MNVYLVKKKIFFYSVVFHFSQTMVSFDFQKFHEDCPASGSCLLNSLRVRLPLMAQISTSTSQWLATPIISVSSLCQHIRQGKLQIKVYVARLGSQSFYWKPCLVAGSGQFSFKSPFAGCLSQGSLSQVPESTLCARFLAILEMLLLSSQYCLSPPSPNLIPPVPLPTHPHSEPSPHLPAIFNESFCVCVLVLFIFKSSSFKFFLSFAYQSCVRFVAETNSLSSYGITLHMDFYLLTLFRCLLILSSHWSVVLNSWACRVIFRKSLLKPLPCNAYVFFQQFQYFRLQDEVFDPFGHMVHMKR